MTDHYPDAGDEPTPYTDFASEHLLMRLRDIVADAPRVPLSASAMVSREEVLELLDEAIDRFPDEMRAARWLLKERDEFLTKVRHEGEEIIDQARARAERLVQRTEVIRAAEQRAYEIVDHAEADARRLRHEVEDFCDQKLASFEIVLERTMTMVNAGREKLQGTNLAAGIPVDDVPGVAAGGAGDEPWDEATDSGGAGGAYGGGQPYDHAANDPYGQAGDDHWGHNNEPVGHDGVFDDPQGVDNPYRDLPPPPGAA
jgi:hypothetical protein